MMPVGYTSEVQVWKIPSGGEVRRLDDWSQFKCVRHHNAQIGSSPVYTFDDFRSPPWDCTFRRGKEGGQQQHKPQ